MKLKLILTTAIVGVALALASYSSAAPPPPVQDSVVLTDAPGVVTPPESPFIFTISELDATSGPSGENPSGLVRFAVLNLNIPFGGPVTCLAVTGNTAIINFQDQMAPAGQIINFHVTDDQPDTFSLGPMGRAPTDCSPNVHPIPGLAGPLISGDITVVDAQPPPTTKQQCKNGGWRNFPQFKSQGQCIAFVNHSP
jgi:hypothetical protein